MLLVGWSERKSRAVCAALHLRASAQASWRCADAAARTARRPPASPRAPRLLRARLVWHPNPRPPRRRNLSRVGQIRCGSRRVCVGAGLGLGRRGRAAPQRRAHYTSAAAGWDVAGLQRAEAQLPLQPTLPQRQVSSPAAHRTPVGAGGGGGGCWTRGRPPRWPRLAVRAAAVGWLRVAPRGVIQRRRCARCTAVALHCWQAGLRCSLCLRRPGLLISSADTCQAVRSNTGAAA